MGRELQRLFAVLFVFPQLEIPKALDSYVFVYYLIWTPSRLHANNSIFHCE